MNDDPDFSSAYTFAYRNLQAGYEHRQITRTLIDSDVDPELAVEAVRQARADIEAQEHERLRQAQIQVYARVTQMLQAGMAAPQIEAQLTSEGVPATVSRAIIADSQKQAEHLRQSRNISRVAVGLGILAAAVTLFIIAYGLGANSRGGGQASPRGVVAVAEPPTFTAIASVPPTTEAAAAADLPTATPSATRTPRPTLTPRPTRTPRPTATPEPTATPLPQVAVRNPELNVREGPSRLYPTITTVAAGKPFEVTGKGYTSERWIQVQLPDRTGWVFGDFTDLAPEVYDALPPRGWYPPTGILQRPDDRRGEGVFTIENEGGRDTVIVLAESSSPHVAVYVRAGDQFTVEGIPDGMYQVFSSTGQEL